MSYDYKTGTFTVGAREAEPKPNLNATLRPNQRPDGAEPCPGRLHGKASRSPPSVGCCQGSFPGMLDERTLAVTFVKENQLGLDLGSGTPV